MKKHEELLVISSRISDWFCKNYPDALKQGLIEYKGWTENILNLRLEEDIFKLFTLAINWNTNICWEIDLAAFEILDKMGFLRAEQLRNIDSVKKTKQRMKSWNFKYLVKQRIRQVQQRPYASPRKIRLHQKNRRQENQSRLRSHHVRANRQSLPSHTA